MTRGGQTARPQRQRVVILGGGYGGAYCAQRLGRLRRKASLDVWIIDRNNYFVFYPLLVEAGTGNLEPRHTVVPIRDFLPSGELRMAEILDVDPRSQIVTYQLGGDDAPQAVKYDHLVIALGSVTRLPPADSPPGVRERAFEMKSLADAVHLRDHAIRMLELANAQVDEHLRREMLHFVVVGGNFSGVEVAGEFDEFLKSASRLYEHVRREECKVTLVELSNRILAPLGEELSAFALRSLRKRGVDVELETTVSAANERSVTLKDGRRIASRTLIWCAGIEPSPIIAKLDLPLDDKGYIRCERDLRVVGFDNTWAIGDCAVNTDAEGNPYPATAQHAVREGIVAAQNIAATIMGQPTQPCDLTNLGQLAAIGCRTGVARVFGINVAGFPAWWLWRTVYLLKMPRLGRKVRVALDWTLDLVFSRDVVQLGVHRERIDRTRSCDGQDTNESLGRRSR